MSVLQIAIVAFIVFFSVILHEIAHGFVALLFGDRTAKEAGRLTLNPIPHIDPLGTILLPAILAFMRLPIFGWAKPVPVNVDNLYPKRLGDICVSLAGIATNFSIAIAAALIFRIARPELNSLPGDILLMAVLINVMLGTFNLLPVPPLDGSRLWLMWMPEKFVQRVYQRVFLWFILLFLFLPLLPINRVIQSIFYGLTGVALR